MEQVEVWRGRHGDPVPLFGPLPGVRAGDVLAYEFELPGRFTPWPGRSVLERVFVLLDLGVSMSLPPWRSTADVSRDGIGPGTCTPAVIPRTGGPTSCPGGCASLPIFLPRWDRSSPGQTEYP